MKITFDPVKRDATFQDRGLAFEEAAEVFAGRVIDIPDLRRDYGELRISTVGTLRGRMVIVVWTQRGETRHIISMRKTNDGEKARFGKRLGES